MFVGHFRPPGSVYGYGSRDSIESGSNPDPSGYGSGSTALVTVIVRVQDQDLLWIQIWEVSMNLKIDGISCPYLEN